MKIFVTGGSGYLGGRFSAYLGDKKHYDVVAGSRSGRDGTVTTDFTNFQQLHDHCRGIDGIVHFAGMNAGDCASADQLKSFG